MKLPALAFACLLLSLPVAETCAAEKGELSVATDKEIRPQSKTEAKLSIEGDTASIEYKIPAPADSYAYVLVNFPLLQKSPKVGSLHFEMRRTNGACQPGSVSISCANGKRAKIDFPEARGQSSNWESYEISVDDFPLAPYDIPEINRVSFGLATNRSKKPTPLISGTIEFKGVQLSESKVKPSIWIPDCSEFKKTPNDGLQGHAIWIYKESEAQLASIIEFNKSASVPIKTLFVHSGSIGRKKEEGRWSIEGFDPEKLKWFRDRAPKNVEIQMNVDSFDGRALSRLPAQEQETLAKLLAETVNSCPFADGVNADIEPYNSKLLPFFIRLKKDCLKKVGAALDNWDMPILKILDAPVLMGYDIGSNPEAFYRAALPKYKAFSRDCSYSGASYYIGIPLIATTMEFEYRESRKSRERLYSGYKMEDFIASGFKAFADAGIEKEPCFAGIAVWGLVDEAKKGVGAPSEEFGFYPQRISPSAFEKLQGLPSKASLNEKRD